MKHILVLPLVFVAALAAAQSAHKATGEVKSVDRKKGTVTLAHGPVESLKWPAMTMKFNARDRKMLDKLKPGDKVEFEFEEKGSKYTITSIK
jgi:Cu(I)/Ag(I) efflux system protein CusF